MNLRKDIMKNQKEVEEYSKIIFNEIMEELLTSDYDVDLTLEQLIYYLLKFLDSREFNHLS